MTGKAWFGILGPLAAGVDGGQRLELAGRKQRELLGRGSADQLREGESRQPSCRRGQRRDLEARARPEAWAT